MTGKQNATVRMFRALKLVIDSFIALWTGNVPFTSANTASNTELGKLDALLPAQAQGTQTATTPKAAKRHELEEATDYLATALKTYGYAEHNAAAIAAGNISRSSIGGLEEEALWAKAQELLDFATPLNTALVPYGIQLSTVPPAAPAFLQQLKLDITAFKGMVGSPKAAKAGVKDATAAIARQIGIISDVLNNRMDGAVKLLRGAQPAFAAAYFAARTIDDAGHQTLALRVRVVDDATALPMQHVLVAVEPAGKHRTTSAAGACQFNTLVGGVATVTCTKVGYAQQAVTANITVGETQDVVVKMVAV